MDTIRRVAVLANPGNPSHVHAVDNIEMAGRLLELSLSMYEAGRTLPSSLLVRADQVIE